MKSKGVGMSALALSLAFLTGYTGSGARADTPPPGCPMFECKTVAAYWDGLESVAFGVHAADTGVASSDGYENIFTPQSNDKLPRNL